MSLYPLRRWLGRGRYCGVTAALMALCITSCAPGSGLRPVAGPSASPYRLAANDEIRIITFGEGQLTGQFRVNDQGNIDVPLLGSIAVNGMTTTDLAHNLERRLKQKELIRDPNVTVDVINYRPIFILGEVTKPGQYPYQPGMTVLTAVAVAGGFTYRAVTDHASIVRSTGGQPIEGRAQRETLVQPGDVIDVFGWAGGCR